MDFEQCSDSADRHATSHDERVALIAQCDRQFIGRRKAGGGYIYYDFLQNRHFDIAGPNPTPSELKLFDHEYARYLDDQRRDAVAAANAEKQNQEALAKLYDDRLAGLVAAPGLRAAAPATVPIPRARSKTACSDTSLSCNWSRFSARIAHFLASNAKISPP